MEPRSGESTPGASGADAEPGGGAVRPRRRLVSVASGDFRGLEGRPVDVQVSLAREKEGRFSIVGLPGRSTRESRERIRAAIQHSGYRFPRENILVNLAPAASEKEGAGFDLPVAVGVLCASDAFEPPGGRHALGRALRDVAFLGELGLEGEVRPVRGALLVADSLRRAGRREIVVARANADEVACLDGLVVRAVNHLRDAVGALLGTVPPVPPRGCLPRETDGRVDFVEVRGQEATKRGLMVAAAGCHNVLLCGSPGVGKTMLARRIPGILPELSLDAALETLRIRSATGGDTRLSSCPPFRAPHHTVSYAGLVGGGLRPAPGEVTRAHRGVLFLDELPEFPRRALEALREPLEEGAITIGRGAGAVTFPADVLLVAAMNPCPCGYLGHPTRACRCSTRQAESYAGRLSGPLLDRIDLFLRVASPGDVLLQAPTAAAGASSATMREAVAAARARQRGRWGDDRPNARVGLDEILRAGRIQPAALSKVRTLGERLRLSARGVARAVRVARTLADLAGSDVVREEHVVEALGWRQQVESG